MSVDRVLGIDVATEKLAFGWLDEDGQVESHTFTLPPRIPANHRLCEWRSYLTDRGMWLLDEVVTVVVEIPWSMRPSFFLLGTAAVTVEALSAFDGPPVIALTTGDWKCQSVGVGNASKAQTLAHAQGLGYDGGDGDVADAVCMAQAGWKLYARRRAA